MVAFMDARTGECVYSKRLVQNETYVLVYTTQLQRNNNDFVGIIRPGSIVNYALKIWFKGQHNILRPPRT